MPTPEEKKRARYEYKREFDKRTYKGFYISLRRDEDSEIIESIESARASGKTHREWLRERFYEK